MKINWCVALLFFLNGMIPEALHANGHGHQTAEHFKPASPIEPLGALTLLCLIATFVLGRTMAKNRQGIFPWHKRMGLITVIAALTHASMVLMFH